MSNPDFERLWREFPKTLPEFEAAFPGEAACRAYWIEVRFGGLVACARCGYAQPYARSNGRYECPRCHYQTSLTAGTVLQGTRKPLKLWFRALWELCVHKQGVSAKDLQRILGFGS
ncbi:MAG: transposase [Gammaproteobacteria bacterium]|nr:transposase [Gammaproteobacteria bacterium]